MEHAELSLQNWAEYLTSPSESRRKILNLISLEISHTPLGKSVVRPRAVRDLDWVTQFWPTQPDSDPAPKVQLYCLMSPAKSYTDWHIDFGGTSVYYHIFTGSKTFLFMAPTPDNMARFEEWSKSPNQSTEILENESAVKTTLYAGDTLFIPSGWLHAVYTSEDSIVIGGNFLHTLAVDMQLQVAHMEESLSIQQKFRFPRLEALHWYAVDWYSNQDRTYFHGLTKRELSGIGALCQWVIGRLGRKNADVPPEVEGEEGARRLLWVLRGEIERRCEEKRAKELDV